MRHLATFTFIALTVLTTAQDEPGPALRGLDPVALCQGKEAPGQPEFELRHGKFRYLFASAQNREVFKGDPARWGIQFDGACMKMGPTSGGGGQDRFAVHEGRIYLFASDACYQWFVLDPAKYIDRADAWEAPTLEQVVEGKAIVDRAVAFLGGTERIAALGNLQMRLRVVEASAREKEVYGVTNTWGPDGYFLRLTEYPPNYRWADLLQPGKGFVLMQTVEQVGDDTYQFLLRSASHEPLILLREALAGRAQYASLGASLDRDGAFHQVRFHLNGAQTVLSVDDASGKIRSAQFKGRSGPGISTVVKKYGDYRSVDGLLVPPLTTTVVNGVPDKEQVTLLVDFTHGKPLPHGFFDPSPIAKD